MLVFKLPVALINDKTKITGTDGMIKISCQSVLFAVDNHFPRSKILHTGVLDGRPLPVARKKREDTKCIKWIKNRICRAFSLWL